MFTVNMNLQITCCSWRKPTFRTKIFHPFMLTFNMYSKITFITCSIITFRTSCLRLTSTFRRLDVVPINLHLEQVNPRPSCILLTCIFRAPDWDAENSHRVHGYLNPSCLLLTCCFRFPLVVEVYSQWNHGYLIPLNTFNVNIQIASLSGYKITFRTWISHSNVYIYNMNP